MQKSKHYAKSFIGKTTMVLGGCVQWAPSYDIHVMIGILTPKGKTWHAVCNKLGVGGNTMEYQSFDDTTGVEWTGDEMATDIDLDELVAMAAEKEER